jgi:hypothetical protein
MTPPFVVHRSGSLHAELDRVALARAFASEPVPAEPRDRIVGPHDVHVIDRIRERDGVRAPHGVPADWFVWGTGEGPYRAVTKLGGVPYLPTAMPWPERDGTVGDFYAQLVFADSRDLVPELPGDVLLVFRFHDLAHRS